MAGENDRLRTFPSSNAKKKKDRQKDRQTESKPTLIRICFTQIADKILPLNNRYCR